MQNEEQLQSVVYLLSDHLCSAIEVADQIMGLRYVSEPISPGLSSENILSRLDDFHRFLDHIRTYEFLLVTKINQARHWALHLRNFESDFRPLIDLFTTSTDIVADASNILETNEEAIFNGEGQPQHLIESRQLFTETLRDEEDGVCQPVCISANENFLLGGKVRLVALIDVCTTFLDSLDARFGMVEDEEQAEELTTEGQVLLLTSRDIRPTQP